MAPVLLRVEHHVGACEVIDAVPGIEIGAPALYVPGGREEAWGLFQPDGQAVSGSLNHRYARRHIIGGQRTRHEGLADLAFDHHEGELVYIGRILRHYGHFLFQTLSRLWCAEALARKGYRFLFHSECNVGQLFAIPSHAGILGALGIGPARLVRFTRPTRLTRVLVPTPCAEEQNFALTRFRSLGLSVGAALIDPREANTEERPVYLSKSRLGQRVSGFVNEDRLERVLAAAGVLVVHPEEMSFAEQVALLSRHRTILATASSALHGTLFVPGGKRIVAIAPTYKLNANCRLVDRLTRNDAQYHFSPYTEVLGQGAGMAAAYRWEDPEGVARALLAIVARPPDGTVPPGRAP